MDWSSEIRYMQRRIVVALLRQMAEELARLMWAGNMIHIDHDPGDEDPEEP